MSDMDKVAHEVPVIMQTAAEHLEKMAADNINLIKRAEAAEAENKRMKLAHRMEERGLQPELTFAEKLERLEKVSEARLATLGDAIEMAAGGVRLGEVRGTDTDQDGTKQSGSQEGGSASDELDSFINNQAAFG